MTGKDEFAKAARKKVTIYKLMKEEVERAKTALGLYRAMQHDKSFLVHVHAPRPQTALVTLSALERTLDEVVKELEEDLIFWQSIEQGFSGRVHDMANTFGLSEDDAKRIVEMLSGGEDENERERQDN